MSEPLTFLASIAPLQSAIQIHHDGGARIKLDIPEDEMPAIVRLLLMRGKVLRVTLEAAGAEPPRKRKAERREPEWGDDQNDDTG